VSAWLTIYCLVLSTASTYLVVIDPVSLFKKAVISLTVTKNSFLARLAMLGY